MLTLEQTVERQKCDRIKVGDAVIFCEFWGAKPGMANVTKITPKGNVIYIDTSKNPFKISKSTFAHYNDGQKTVYLYSDKLFQRLIRDAEIFETNEANKRTKREEDIKQRELDIALQLKQVMEAFNTSCPFTSREVLPNGKRLYRIDVPIQPKHSVRKHGYCIAFVMCNDDIDYIGTSNVEKKVVSCDTCYTHGGNSSFTFTSNQTYDTDEDALWDIARHLYHSSL